jgi:hypothetical protein
MAAPTYDTDLVLIADAEATSEGTGAGGPGGSWTSFNGSGGSSLGAGQDFSMQGTNAIDMKISSSNGTRGPIFQPTGGASITGDQKFFIWSFVATPGILTPSSGPGTAFGSGLFVGDSTNSNGAHFIYNVNTADSFGAANRVGQCYRLDTSAGPSTAGETSGNPTSPYTYIGSCASFSQNSKGSNFATDVIRKGTGFYVTDGDTSTPITFLGIGDNDENKANRWGIVTKLSESSFDVNGWVVIGQTSGGTDVDSFMESVGESLIFKGGYGASNGTGDLVFKVRGTNTEVKLKQSSFSNSFTSNCPTMSWEQGTSEVTACTFSGCADFDLLSNHTATFTDCVFTKLDPDAGVACIRSSNTANRFVGCKFQRGSSVSTTVAIISIEDPLEISNCTFEDIGTSGAYGHAVDLNTISTATTFTWDSKLEGRYTAGSAGSPVTTTSTGQEAIRVTYTDTSNPLVIGVAAGATIPTIKNDGAGAINVVVNQVSVSVTVVDSSGGTIDGARVYLEAAAGGPLSVGTVIIDKVLTVSGIASTSLSLASDQPVVGNIRKASSSPFYKAATVPGGTSISSTAGLSLNVQLISDE